MPASPRRVVDMAHLVGVSVEGELGVLGSLESGMGEAEDGHGFEGKLSHDMLVTDPDEAAKFVAETKVDALAVAIGTSHGAYKFTRKPTGEVLAMSVIEAIHQRLPNTHMVMHGSSSVPQDLLEEINANGGEIRETYGVPVEEIVRGIKHGVRKVNIDTDLRLAATSAIRKVLHNEPGRVRSAQISQARDRRHAEDLQGALRAVRHGGQCRQDQGDAARRHGQALRQGRARPEDRHRESRRGVGGRVGSAGEGDPPRRGGAIRIACAGR